MTSSSLPTAPRAGGGWATWVSLACGVAAAFAFVLLHGADAAVDRLPYRVQVERTEHAATMWLTLDDDALRVEPSCECVRIRRLGTVDYEIVVLCREIPAKVLPGVHLRSPAGGQWFVPLDCAE